MSFLVEPPCLAAAIRLTVSSVLRGILPRAFLPAPFYGHGTGEESRVVPSTSGRSASARAAKDSLRVSTYEQVVADRAEGSEKAEEDEKQEICAVCLGELRRRDRVRVPASCRHIYHQRCLDRWLDHDELGTCPLCRVPLLQAPAARHGTPTEPPEPSWAVEQLLYIFADGPMTAVVPPSSPR